jgi:hypothetical protein
MPPVTFGLSTKYQESACKRVLAVKRYGGAYPVIPFR